MPIFPGSRYVIRLPEAFRQIDPEFADQWILPFFHEDGSFSLPPDADLSPLADYVPTDLDTLARQQPGIFSVDGFRCAVEQSVPPEEAEAALLSSCSDRELAVSNACFPLILSVANDYSWNEFSFLSLADTCLTALKDALPSFVPGRSGGLRGYALWHVRFAAIRWVWDCHPENPQRDTGKMTPEYRLRDPEDYIAHPGEEIPPVAVSSIPMARLYRKLKQQEPELFRDIMDTMTRRENEVLALILQENCLLTVYDAADRFSVPLPRIVQILNRLRRRFRSPRIRAALNAAGLLPVSNPSAP